MEVLRLIKQVDLGAATGAAAWDLVGVSASGPGEIAWLSDGSPDRLLCIDLAREDTQLLLPPGGPTPGDLAFDRQGYLYQTERHRFRLHLPEATVEPGRTVLGGPFPISRISAFPEGGAVVAFPIDARGRCWQAWAFSRRGERLWRWPAPPETQMTIPLCEAETVSVVTGAEFLLWHRLDLDGTWKGMRALAAPLPGAAAGADRGWLGSQPPMLQLLDACLGPFPESLLVLVRLFAGWMFQPCLLLLCGWNQAPQVYWLPEACDRLRLLGSDRLVGISAWCGGEKPGRLLLFAAPTWEQGMPLARVLARLPVNGSAAAEAAFTGRGA
jgi:hypothetical protein